MAIYEYKCNNEKCEDFGKVKQISMSINDYSEDKLPNCNKCNEKTFRNYNAIGHQTFGDGYKG